MLPYPLPNFEIQNNLPKIKDGKFVINLDQYKSIGTHWITYFDSFGVEHIPKEI